MKVYLNKLVAMMMQQICLVWGNTDNINDEKITLVRATRRSAIVDAYREVLFELSDKKYFHVPQKPEDCIKYIKELLPNQSICGPHGDGDRWCGKSSYAPTFDDPCGDVEVMTYLNSNLHYGPASYFEQIIVFPCEAEFEADLEMHLDEKRTIEQYIDGGDRHQRSAIAITLPLTPSGDVFDIAFDERKKENDRISQRTKIETLSAGTKLYYSSQHNVAFVKSVKPPNLIVF